MRKRRALTVGITAAAVVCLTAGYAIADISGALPGGLSVMKRVYAERTIAALNPHTSLVNFAQATVRDAHNKTIDANKAQKLVDDIAGSLGSGNTAGIAIADTSGKVIASHKAGDSFEPASTLKTLTAFAASVTFDPMETLTTSVRLERNDSHGHDKDQEGTLTLVGGGDILLGEGQNDSQHITGRAGLATLADRTVKALKSRDITRVSLQYDDSLFNNDVLPPQLSSTSGVNEGYVNEIETTSMAIDEARAWGGQAPSNLDAELQWLPQRSAHPASDTADTFAQYLRDRGITVTNSDFSNSKASDDASDIASVNSAPMWQIIQLMLTRSDNSLAQLLGRLLALRLDKENSLDGSTQAVIEITQQHGISTRSLTMADTSGLAPGSAVTPTTLIQVQSAFLNTSSTTWAAAAGMPISQYSGTLAGRDFSEQARGLIRAKTGTLDNVTSLAGNASRLNGGTLIFAIVVNGNDVVSGRVAIDRFASKLVEL